MNFYAIHITIAIRLLYLVQKLRRNRNPIVRASSKPIQFVYRFYSLFIIGFDIPTSTVIGRNLKIYHGIGLVVSASSKIGDNVTLRQNTTIGVANKGGAGPLS